MLNFEELRYLSAFAEARTLSEVAEQCNISQLTITRAMKKVEEEFGVSLFERTKNSIRLNEVGMLAASEADLILRRADEMISRVRIFDRARHTISIGSSAAVQIPELVNRLSESYPGMTISTELKKPDELTAGLEKDIYQLIVLPYEPTDTSLISTVIGEEHLMFFLPKKHRFAKRKTMTMSEMNGENMLLFSAIGFWYDITKEKMPDSRFLIQNERYSLEELIDNSILPCFVTDLSLRQRHASEDRVAVPITDPEVNVTYYLVCKKENRKKFSALFVKSSESILSAN